MAPAPRHLRLVPRRGRVRACLAAVAATIAACAALVNPGVAFAAPAVACAAERAGARTLVEVRLLDFLDAELLRLIRLGLRGRVHVEAILFRRRRLWVDERLAQDAQSFGLTWSKERSRYVLEDVPVAEPARFVLPVLALRGGGPPPAGALYVEVSVRMEVVTAGSLGQVAQWIVGRDPRRGEDEKAAPPVGVTRALVDFLAADLARTADTRCAVRS